MLCPLDERECMLNTDQVQNFLKWLSRIVSIGLFPSFAFTIIETASATVSSPDLGESFLVLFDRFLPEHVFSVSRCCRLPLARADWKVDISMLCKSRRERMGSRRRMAPLDAWTFSARPSCCLPTFTCWPCFYMLLGKALAQGIRKYFMRKITSSFLCFKSSDICIYILYLYIYMFIFSYILYINIYW